MTELSLTREQARQIMILAGFTGDADIRFVKQHNHVWELITPDGTFFLKAPSKDWCGGDVEREGLTVNHEGEAWDCLAANGLTVPEVVLSFTHGENPLAHPFLLTRKLRGIPLTASLSAATMDEALRKVGEYLQRMHRIEFPFPGYIMTGGPSRPLRDDEWTHRCWTAKKRQQDALDCLETNAFSLPDDLRQVLRSETLSMGARLASAYTPPHFVQGDCHAHQFFVDTDRDGVHVTGVVDMEVASAGDSGEDLLHLFMEPSHRLPVESRWWEKFFAGYGELHFDLFRLRMLGVTPIEFQVSHWPGSYEQILRHILRARSWYEIFSLSDIGS